MLLLIRLLNMSPKIARAFRDFAIGFAAWTHADLDAIKKWFDSRRSNSTKCWWSNLH